MVERIRELITYKNLSASQFADGIEIPRAVLSHIMSGRNKPSLEVITKILQEHDDISLEWLLLGKGQMLKKLNEQKPAKATREEESKSEAKPSEQKQPPQEQFLVSELLAQPQTDRQIEKIIIFYSDKKFTAYTPD
ncbi:helix-turn-helix domain-containing protein [Pontibacter arcticus]|uniref:Transcriptional regulator n=1 Tax=Pontibacter arcticus TaxID=2080288 RepID=A0A364RG96_9BACT|nr:helix-turn-helix transcriptional regulator [Pontibacter arcticus]RAU83319.1 transcriptional regulator [Pontibacter arcticus]